MKNNFALVGIVFALFCLTFVSGVLALPCAFAGSVKANYTGDYVPVNPALVTAFESGTETPLVIQHNTHFETNPGIYYIIINDETGKNIKFKINGVYVDQPEHICNEDAYEYNLTANLCADSDGDGYGVANFDKCVHPEFDCNDNNAAINPGAVDTCGDGIDNDCDGTPKSCGGGGGGTTGGGGGSTAYCGDGTVQAWTGEQCEKNSDCNATFVCNTSCKCIPCTETWSCGEWGTCSSEGVQTRTCTDANACGTIVDKPKESQTCTPSGGSGSSAQPLGGLLCGNDVCDDGESCDTCPEDCGACGAGTGAVVGTQSGTGLIGMIFGLPGLPFIGLLVLLLIALLVLLMTRKKKKK